MAKVLATDLDGTLMYPARLSRCIPIRNVLFLRKWIDAGNKLVMVTSRGPEFMKRLKDEIQRDFDYICYTSSYIVSEGKVIRDQSMSTEVIDPILDDIFHTYHPIAFLLNAKNRPLLIADVSGVGWALLLVYKLYWLFQGKRREKYILNYKSFDEGVKSGNIYKVMVFFGLGRNKNHISKAINKQLREKYPNVESSWSSVINEITPLNCNKGAGLEYYCNALNIKPDDVYVVGDSGNDISMFNKFHEHSYAMAKAYPSVKKYAKHVIRRVYELDKLVLEKGEKENE